MQILVWAYLPGALHTRYRPFTPNAHTLLTPWMHPVDSVHPPCRLYTHPACSLPTPCTFPTHTLHTLCTLPTHNLHTHCTHPTHALHIRCTLTAYTLHRASTECGQLYWWREETDFWKKRKKKLEFKYAKRKNVAY